MRKFLMVCALGALAAGFLATSGSAATAPCGVHAAPGTNRFGGVISPMDIASTGACAVHNTGDPNSFGVPPLLWWGGPVMGTGATTQITVTPIYWNPSGGGHPMSSNYKSLMTQYLSDVAKASGKNTNVYSVATEYSDSNGFVPYNIKLGPAIDDSHALPANGCSVAADDTTNIYVDGTGYNACLDDDQLTAEIQRVITSKGLPQNDYSHIYVMYTSKHVESCFFGGSSETNNVCTINHHPTAGYCAYHSMMGTNWPDYGTIYANMPYPIYNSPVGFTCGSDAGGGTLQSPNHNLDADTETSPTSHELIEAFTDPNVFNGWYDSVGEEIGDDCAYVYGTQTGKAGQMYNQVINGHQYLTQEEFSNKDFADTGGGCIPSEAAAG